MLETSENKNSSKPSKFSILIALQHTHVITPLITYDFHCPPSSTRRIFNASSIPSRGNQSHWLKNGQFEGQKWKCCWQLYEEVTIINQWWTERKLKFPHMRNAAQSWGWLLFIILLILKLHVGNYKDTSCDFWFRKRDERKSLGAMTRRRRRRFSSERDTAGRIHKADARFVARLFSFPSLPQDSSQKIINKIQ
jgi:hypothetical protein